MIRSDFHLHTLFSDGKNTPEEMVLAAIEKGMTAIGFSDHSYTAFDESYCMPRERAGEYRRTIADLKERYKDKIKVLCGIEQDFYSDEPTDDYDYVIGSVHYIKVGEDYVPIDESPEILVKAAEKYFSGDIYCIVEEYFKTVSQVVERTRADIIGHFDLITKFNRDAKLFDERSERYRKAAESALNALLTHSVPFEVNTGGVSRGYTSHPYPSRDWIGIIREKGGRLVLSSDSHSKDNLCYGFENYQDICDVFLK